MGATAENLLTDDWLEGANEIAAFLGWKPRKVRLSLSEIKSEHRDDLIRREFGSRGCFQWLEWPAAPAHLVQG